MGRMTPVNRQIIKPILLRTVMNGCATWLWNGSPGRGRIARLWRQAGCTQLAALLEHAANLPGSKNLNKWIQSELNDLKLPSESPAAAVAADVAEVVAVAVAVVVVAAAAAVAVVAAAVAGERASVTEIQWCCWCWSLPTCPPEGWPNQINRWNERRGDRHSRWAVCRQVAWQRRCLHWWRRRSGRSGAGWTRFWRRGPTANRGAAAFGFHRRDPCDWCGWSSMAPISSWSGGRCSCFVIKSPSVDNLIEGGRRGGGGGKEGRRDWSLRRFRRPIILPDGESPSRPRLVLTGSPLAHQNHFALGNIHRIAN